ATGSGQPKYACSTTPHYLQIATSFGEGGSAIVLPASEAPDSSWAPIEVWVHESLIHDRIAAAADLFKTQVEAGRLMNALSALPGMFGGIAAVGGQSDSPVEEQRIRLRTAGEWQVIEW